MNRFRQVATPNVARRLQKALGIGPVGDHVTRSGIGKQHGAADWHVPGLAGVGVADLPGQSESG